MPLPGKRASNDLHSPSLRRFSRLNCFAVIIRLVTRLIEAWILPILWNIERTPVSYRLRQFDHFSDRQRASVALALQQWSGFLLGDEPHPGAYEQHFLPLDAIESFSGGDMPANINRYFLRAVDVTLAAGDGGAVVYSNFAKFILVGFIDVPHPKHWVGTKVHVRQGHVGQGHVTLPNAFGDFLFARCRRYDEVKAQISENQQAKIAASMRKDLDKAAASKSFKALQYEVEMFGDAAFSSVKPPDEG